jgi:hypothetical protein
MGCARAEQSAPPHRIVSEMMAMQKAARCTPHRPQRHSGDARERAAIPRRARMSLAAKGFSHATTTGTARGFG